MNGRPHWPRGTLLGLSAVALLMTASASQAQTSPSILGTYNGTFSGQDHFCSPPTIAESFHGTISFTVNDQQGALFTGSGTIHDTTDGETDPISISGSIAPSGSVTGDFTVDDPVDPASATFSGSLSGNVLRLNFDGSDSECNFTGSITVSRGASAGVDPENAPGNAVTTQTEVDSFARGQPLANSNRIRNILRGGGNNVQASANGLTLSGMSAGDGNSMPVGAWVGYSYTDTENDFSTTAFTSTRHSVLFGLDTMPSDDLLLGVSVGIERVDVDTRFNSGEQDLSAITVAPYLGLLINDWLTLDATVGIGNVNNDQFRLQGATRIDSEVDSIRWFANTNLAATYTSDALHLTGLAGLLWVTQRDDDFFESNGQFTQDSHYNVGRALLGGEIAYSIGAWEPYASGLFEYDFTSTSQQYAAGVVAPQNDQTDVLVSAGLRYFGNNNISGALEYNTLFGRQDLDEYSINASIRWEF